MKSTRMKDLEDAVADVDEETGMLAAMGFTDEQARDALAANNGNVDDAVKNLLSRRHSDNLESNAVPPLSGAGAVHFLDAALYKNDSLT